MPHYEVKDVLETMFADSSELMEELSKDSGEFTFKRFLQTCMRRHQVEYIELLQRCTGHPSAGHHMPFNIAHQHIGGRLRRVAENEGYQRFEEGYVDDIFGNPTKNIVYRRD
ncbi:MAG: hypothetical protein GX484_02280 [Chloroflexi bacterium]|nr:hypothetical protein [Chloroflexota bacterium]